MKYEDDLLEIVRPLGIQTMEEWYEAISGEIKGWEILREESAGFETLADAIDAMHDRDTSEATEFLIQHDGKYIAWQICGISNGYGEDSVLPEVFDNLEDAEKAFERQIEANERSIMQQIFAAKAELPYDPYDTYIKPWSSMECSFRVYYKRLMVLDHARSIDPKQIQEAVEKLIAFENQHNVTVTELYKLPREWNNNQRYYQVSVRDNDSGKHSELKVHIPSKLQHRPRMPIALTEAALGKSCFL